MPTIFLRVFPKGLNGSILNKAFTNWKGFIFGELIIFAAHYERKKGHFYCIVDYRRRPGPEDLDKNAYAPESYLGRILSLACFSI